MLMVLYPVNMLLAVDMPVDFISGLEAAYLHMPQGLLFVQAMDSRLYCLIL